MLKDMIKRHEGLRLKVYTDTLGHPTIGFGRALDTNGITQREAEFLLDADITRSVNGARRVYGEDFGSIGAVRQAALIDMAMQLGETGLSKFGKMLSAMRSGDWEAAKANALASKWAKQTPNRAREIAAMIETGEWPGAAESPSSLKGSRTIAGAQIAATGTVGAGATAAVSDQISSISDTLASVAHYSKWIALAFTVITLIGIGVVVYARWTDFKSGANA